MSFISKCPSWCLCDIIIYCDIIHCDTIYCKKAGLCNQRLQPSSPHPKSGHRFLSEGHLLRYTENPGQSGSVNSDEDTCTLVQTEVGQHRRIRTRLQNQYPYITTNDSQLKMCALDLIPLATFGKSTASVLRGNTQ